MSSSTDHDEFRLEHEWRWDIHFLGWRRCLWLSVALDFGSYTFGVILFGWLICYGWMLKPVECWTTPSWRRGDWKTGFDPIHLGM